MSSTPPVWRSAITLLRDPEDIIAVRDLYDALAGSAHLRLAERLRASEPGRALLERRPSVRRALSDHRELEALPADSLGAAYLELCRRRGLKAQLRDAMEINVEAAAEPTEERFVRGLLRDSHDLYHVVTGYSTDLVGEFALLLFTQIQAGNPAIAALCTVAGVRTLPYLRNAAPLAIDAIRRARRAHWFPAQDWGSLLCEPLADVRSRLRVGAPPSQSMGVLDLALGSRAA